MTEFMDEVKAPKFIGDGSQMTVEGQGNLKDSLAGKFERNGGDITGALTVKETLSVEKDATIGGNLHLKSNLFIEGGHPIQIKTYSLDDNPFHPTGYNASEWSAAIVGVEVKKTGLRDVQAFQFYMTVNDGSWHIRADVEGIHESWVLHVMFIRKELVKDDR